MSKSTNTKHLKHQYCQSNCPAYESTNTKDTLEKHMPRCETLDKDDFKDIHEDERCFNCKTWELIDKDRQQLLQRIKEEMPKQTDNHRLFLVVGDHDKSEDEIRLYAKLRQDGHNQAIRQITAILETMEKEVGGSDE